MNYKPFWRVNFTRALYINALASAPRDQKKPPVDSAYILNNEKLVLHGSGKPLSNHCRILKLGRPRVLFYIGLSSKGQDSSFYGFPVSVSYKTRFAQEFRHIYVIYIYVIYICIGDA